MNHRQPGLRQVCRAGVDEVTRRPLRVEFFLEVVQALEVIELVHVFVDEVHDAFKRRIIGFFTDAGKRAQSQIETVVAALPCPLKRGHEQELHRPVLHPAAMTHQVNGDFVAPVFRDDVCKGADPSLRRVHGSNR